VLSSTVAKYLLAVGFLKSPFIPPFCCHGDELYWPSFTLGLSVASARIFDCFPWYFTGFVSLSRTSLDRTGLGRVVIS
jgi:hypothetical protein